MLPSECLPALMALITIVSAKESRITIAQGPTNTTVSRGSTVELRCTFRNGDPSRFMWLRSDGAVITSGSMVVDVSRTYALAGNLSNGEYNLVLSNVQAEDDGEYSCGYTPTTDGDDFVSESGFIVVQTPPGPGFPRCSVDPVNPRVGDNVRLTCRSEGGNPPANLNWYGGPIGTRPSVQGTNVLRKLLRIGDVGTSYTCVASSPAETASRSCGIIPVDISPSVEITKSSMLEHVGGEVAFTCVRIDKPEQTDFHWYYKGKSVLELRGSNRFRILEDGKTLNVKRLQMGDNGAEIGCRMTIYGRIMRKALSTISLEMTSHHTQRPNEQTLSFRNDLVTQMRDLTDVTYDLESSSYNDPDLERENGRIPLIILIVSPILVTLTFVFVVSLLCLKRNRHSKVISTSAVASEGRTQRSNNQELRHNYETSFPKSPTETDGTVSASEHGDEVAHYHDISDGATGDERRKASATDSPGINASMPEEPVVYEIPLPKIQDTAVRLDYRTFSGSTGNHLEGSGISSAEDYPVVNKALRTPVLRSVKSESSLSDKAALNDPQARSAKKLPVSDHTIRAERGEIPEAKGSTTPTTTKAKAPIPLPRPTNFIVQNKNKTASDTAFYHDITPLNTHSKGSASKTPDSPMKGPLFRKNMPSPGKPRFSPRTPDRDITQKVDRDGYEVPKRTTPVTGCRRVIQDGDEYEQVDQVTMTSPVVENLRRQNRVASPDHHQRKAREEPQVQSGRKISASNGAGSNEYTELEGFVNRQSSYQPLSPSTSGSSITPTTPGHMESPSNEYEIPGILTAKPSSERPEYLEILD